MPKIEKHGNLYRARVSTGEKVDGKYRYITLTDETEAGLKRKLLDYEIDREQAEYEQKTGNVTLAKAMEGYIATCTAAKRSPSTLRQYIGYQKKEYAEIREYRLRQIKRRDIQSLVDGWCMKGQSPKTVRNKLSFLTASMRYADVAPPIKGLVLPEKEQKEMTIPQDCDVQKMLFYLRARDTQLYLAVVLASTLGLRRGEICALSMSDFDFDRGTVSITKSIVMDKNKEWQIKIPKTKAGRRVLRFPQLVRYAVEQFGNQDRIITINPNMVSMRYKRVRSALNVPGRFHDLRHYKASVMATLGATMKEMKDIMGHATNDMLNRVYVHTMQAHVAVLDDRVAEHDNDLLSGKTIIYDQDYVQKAK